MAVPHRKNGEISTSGLDAIFGKGNGSGIRGALRVSELGVGLESIGEESIGAGIASRILTLK